MPRYVAVVRVSEDAGRVVEVRWANRLSDLESLKAQHGKYIHENPVEAGSRHRILVSIYQMPVGWRLPDFRKLERKVRQLRNQGLYWYSVNDLVAKMVAEEGLEIFPSGR